ncbi:MAG TPA: acyltransferase [Planctomycetota bacterium]|nr:acyltransferase [Planctomycetota bacterium]
MTQAIPPAPAAPDRIAALDGVRGLAILLVVVMHTTLVFFTSRLPSAEHMAPDDPFAFLPFLGWCGVDVFFVLSGFLITGILVRSKGQPHYFRDFYARRALRIFPLYYAVIVLLLFVLPRSPVSDAARVSHLLYYQNIRYALGDVPADFALVVTWSLAIEEQFYLVWPAVVRLLSRRALAATSVAIVAAAIGLRLWLLATTDVRVHFLLPCRMDTLALGALLALVPLPPAWLGRLLVLAGGLGLPAIAWAGGTSLPEAAGMQRLGLPAALAFAAGVLMLARGDGIVARVCRNRALRSFGKYSYCIYLTHLLVIETIAGWIADPRLLDARTWITANCSGAVVLAAFTLLSLAASWLLGFASWHLYEKHFLACKRFFGGAQT